MIITRIMGGHSNQLFQYAAGRSLAARLKTELKLDVNTYFDDQPAENTPREYELTPYPLKAAIAKPQEIKSALEERAKGGRLKSLFGNGGKFDVYSEKPSPFEPEFNRLPNNTYLIGYWQNEKYFKDIRQELIDVFEPKTPMSLRNKKYLSQIQSSEAISLHVRREDYVSNKGANEFHGLVPMDYYKAGLEIVLGKAKKTGVHIYVFSKEISWCKKNIQLNQPVTFIEGNKDGADDMRLMKHCKHNIMANSSFSWWGSWLNQNPNKIVVAPKTWFQEPVANKNMELPKAWIRI